MGCASSHETDTPDSKDSKQAGPYAAATAKAAVGKRSASEVTKSARDILSTKQGGDIREHYTFDRVLGKGNFGIVHLVMDKSSGEAFACKSISKRKLVAKDDIEDVRREVQILMHLSGHKNVVQIYGVYEDQSFIHMVMELCEGGELFDRFGSKNKFSEKGAAEFMRTIVQVVNHCHTMNVVHRDIKPENFLLSSRSSGGIIKATDFGLSRFFKEGELLDEIVGSPFYVAPEVLQRRYNKEADIWSCGVILYILLSGSPPFQGNSTQQIFRNIISQPLDLKSAAWEHVSDAAKDCVRRMLSRDPKRRLTAEQVLRHPWMRENGLAGQEDMTPEVLTRLKTFGQMNHLKKEALKIIARKLPNQELHGMKEMFKALDADGSGFITVDELREGLRKKGAELAYQEVVKILDEIDMDGNQKVDYEEFMAATIHMNKLSREELMIQAFKHFDKDNSGFITMEELNIALADVGVDSDMVKAILEAADTNNDGKIDYEEFAVMMRNNDFESLVRAKTALKTKMTILPSQSVILEASNVDYGLDEEQEGLELTPRGQASMDIKVPPSSRIADPLTELAKDLAFGVGASGGKVTPTVVE